MKIKIQGALKLEIAIVIAFLILAALVIVTLKLNQEVSLEKKTIIKKVEEREAVFIKKLPVTTHKLGKPKEADRRELTRYKKEELKEEKERFTVSEFGKFRYRPEEPRWTPGRRGVSLPAEGGHLVEEIRQRQMEQLRKDSRKSSAEVEKGSVKSEEESTATTKYDIYPNEEDIKKMEKEKALLY